MGSNTPDFSLYRPDAGEDDWASNVNSNFDTIDEELNRWESTTQTSNYTASNYDIVLADASSGNITITLPSPASDLTVIIKKIDSSSNSVTIATPGSETIDGDNSRSITSQYTSRTVASDGTNYFLI